MEALFKMCLALEEPVHHRRGDSESDSDASEGRSLDLASSHSSDDDESSTAHGHRSQRRSSSSGLRNVGSSTVGYLPNITEHVISRCGTPPALNVVTNSQLFPNVNQSYGRWESQLPDAYLPNANGKFMQKLRTFCDVMNIICCSWRNRSLVRRYGFG